MEELKDCPYCTKEENKEEPQILATEAGYYYAEHDYCGARGPACGTVIEAIAAWNRRG